MSSSEHSFLHRATFPMPNSFTSVGGIVSSIKRRFPLRSIVCLINANSPASSKSGESSTRLMASILSQAGGGALNVSILEM